MNDTSELLAIPATVYEAIRALNARDIEAFLMMLTPNPSVFAAGWAQCDTRVALVEPRSTGHWTSHRRAHV
ncbi:hypothetical protein ACFWNH_29265 [Rhodococcus qingshengii]|uniref:hypothetical protein n=1 Tax=Rhodococcus qingshengii TaxID=334542 RepID=UPI0036015815